MPHSCRSEKGYNQRFSFAPSLAIRFQNRANAAIVNVAHTCALRGSFGGSDAFKREFLIDSGDTFTEVDGREVRLIYFPEYGSIMAFKSDGYLGPVSPTGGGRTLECEGPLMSQVFWIVPVHFCPETAVNNRATGQARP